MMKALETKIAVKLTIIIPCYNEEATLEACVKKVLEIEDDALSLEILIVDDGSDDGSLQTAHRLAREHSQIIVLAHDRNQGKGAALRTGFQKATGEFVAIQDADLEYNPAELKNLLVPSIKTCVEGWGKKPGKFMKTDSQKKNMYPGL